MEDFLDTYLGSAESYLNPTEELKARSLAGLKTFFGFYKKVAKDLEEFETRPGCRHISTGPLPELYTEGLDNDQIWEQIQLVNQPVIKGLKSVVANIAAKVDRGEFTLQTNSDSSGGNIKVSNNEELDDQRQNSLNEEVDDEISCDFGVSDEECLERRPDLVKISAGRKSVVDDKFFRLSEMEKFLEMVEKEEAGLFIVYSEQSSLLNGLVRLLSFEIGIKI